MYKRQAGAPAAVAGSSSGGLAPATMGNDAIDKACREARELTEQIQQQMTQSEQSRITERQQLVDKLEQRDAQMKTINEKNAAVSYYYYYRHHPYWTYHWYCCSEFQPDHWLSLGPYVVDKQTYKHSDTYIIIDEVPTVTPSLKT